MTDQKSKDSKGGFVINLACVLAVAAVTWPPFKVLSVYGVLIAPLIVSYLVLCGENTLLQLNLNQKLRLLSRHSRPTKTTQRRSGHL